MFQEQRYHGVPSTVTCIVLLSFHTLIMIDLVFKYRVYKYINLLNFSYPLIK